MHYIGANAHLTLDDIDFSMVESGSILHIGRVVGAAWHRRTTDSRIAATWPRLAGVTTFLDTVWDDTGRWMEILQPCLPYIDYFVPSLPEAQALTGLDDPTEVARALLEHGVRTVGLKMGVQRLPGDER